MKIEVSGLLYNIAMILLVIVASFILTKFISRMAKKREEDQE